MSIAERGTGQLTMAAAVAAAIALGGCGQGADSADDLVFTLNATDPSAGCILTGPEEVPAGEIYTIIVEDKDLFPSITYVLELGDTTLEEFMSWGVPGTVNPDERNLPSASLDSEATREFNETQDLPEGAVAYSYVAEPGRWVVLEWLLDGWEAWPPERRFLEATLCGTFEVA
jgi:hypothetical protein